MASLRITTLKLLQCGAAYLPGTASRWSFSGFTPNVSGGWERYPSRRRACQRILRTGALMVNVDLVLERPDLSQLNVLATITPLRDAAGVVTGAVNVFQDITELKRIQQDREGLLRELERSNRDLSQFSYSVSHGLQAPVRGVRALTKTPGA